MAFFGALVQHVHSQWRLGTGERWDALFEDASLGVRDLVQRVAQDLRVVQIQCRDATDDWLWDDVGRVQTSADADLQDHDVDALLRERVQRHERQEAEEPGHGRVLAALVGCSLQSVPHGVEVLEEELLRDRLAVDAEPLAGRDEMRRREEPSLVPCLAEDTLDHGAGGALALGARDVDDRELLVHGLRQVQPRQVVLHHGDRLLAGRDIAIFARLQVLERGAHAEQTVQRRVHALLEVLRREE